MGQKHSVEYVQDPALVEHMKSMDKLNQDLHGMILQGQSERAELGKELSRSRKAAEEAMREQHTMSKQLQLLTQQLDQYQKRVLLPRSVIERLGKPADVLVKEAKAYYKALGIELDMSKLLIAVVGVSGTGKSSLINTLRGKRDYEEGAAKVGVQEMVIRPTLYAWKDSMALVDFPGGSTKTFEEADYVMEFKMYCFDVVIVVFSVRITSLAVTIANEMRSFGRKTLLLRGKCDQEVENILDSHPPGSMDDAGAKRFLRRQTEESLAMNAPWFPPSDLYLVSAKQAGRGIYNFDEARLLGRLSELAATAAKQT